jgi:hypothetical protein
VDVSEPAQMDINRIPLQNNIKFLTFVSKNLEEKNLEESEHPRLYVPVQ